ncbi:MAG: hypothetical protein ACPGSB_04215 [Opitutales bacterium]
MSRQFTIYLFLYIGMSVGAFYLGRRGAMVVEPPKFFVEEPVHVARPETAHPNKDYAAALDLALERPEEFERLIAEWAGREPEAALNYAIEGSKSVGPASSRAAFRVWLEVEPGDAVDWLLQLEDKQLAKDLHEQTNWMWLETPLLVRVVEQGYPRRPTYVLSKRLSRLDPLALILLINEAPADHVHKLSSNLYYTRVEDSAHFEALLGAMNDTNRDRNFGSLLRRWAKHDALAAAAWQQEHQDDPVYGPLLTGRLALQAGILEISPSMSLSLVTSAFRTALSESLNPVAWAEANLTPDQRGAVYARMFDDIMQKRPEMLSEVWPEMAHGDVRDGILKRSRTLNIVMREIPREVLDSIRGSMPSRTRDDQCAAAFKAWISIDFQAAKAYLSEADWIPPGRYNELQTALVLEHARKDKREAITMAQSLPEVNGRKDTLNRLLGDLVGRGDSEFVKGTIDAMPHGQARSAAILGVLGELAYQDPDASFSWIQFEQDRSFNRQAYSIIARQWIDRDPDRAEYWARYTLPATEARDVALSSMITHRLGVREPEAAFSLVTLLKDSGQMKRDMSRTFQKWHEIDPAAAEQAVSSHSELDEQTKAELFRLIEN